MLVKKWSEWGDRVAPPGSINRQVVDMLKERGRVSSSEFTDWLRKNTDYVPDGFTDEQLGVGLSSLFEILENYGAIELDSDGIRYTGG